jgi:4-oxalocrotonate tautomerase
MPIINVSVTGKPDARLSAAIASEVTEITATRLRKDPTITAVAVNYMDPQHWFAGGKSLAEHGNNTFWLDIKVVDGTSTKLELEAYLKAIFDAFGRLLGEVHE